MRTTRQGYTIIELMMAITVAGTAAAMAIPQVSRTVSHTRVNQAASLVVAELEQAAALAARERKPVRLTVNSSTKSIVITDRATGAVLANDKYSLATEYHLSTVSGTPSQLDIYPNGTISSSLTITLGVMNYSRQVTMSRAAQVRLVSLQNGAGGGQNGQDGQDGQRQGESP